MSSPPSPPIGVHLARAAKTVSRAFDDALAEAGSSVPIWLVLIALRGRPEGNQRELAEAIGIREATLTHHLNAMEADGLLTRRRDPDNRRIHRVELTELGDALFHRLRVAAVSFDQRLRDGISDAEVARFQGLLDRLQRNARTPPSDIA